MLGVKGPDLVTFTSAKARFPPGESERECATLHKFVFCASFKILGHALSISNQVNKREFSTLNSIDIGRYRGRTEISDYKHSKKHQKTPLKMS